MNKIQWFAEINKNDVLIAGGKGANLGEMTQAGLPVPPGFCVTVAAYQAFLEQTKLGPAVRNAYHDIDPEDLVQIGAMAGNIRGLIESQPFPEFIAEPILKAYNQLGPSDTPVAVRSSATAEDLEEASFAGQHDTYLNVRGEAALLDQIRKCWASLWTDRAVTYRTKNRIDHLAVYVSVVVQQMIEAEISGIMFTAHPQTLNRRKVFIESSYGLGEAIVSGMVTPDEFLVEKLDNLVARKILGDKAVKIIYDNGAGIVEREVPVNHQKVFTLNETCIKELVSLAKAVEKHYDRPMDTEWAYQGHSLYLLQARPITTESIHPPGEYNRTMFIDIFPDPLSPIFLSVISPLFKNMLDYSFEKLGFVPPDHIPGTGHFYNQVYFNRDYITETLKPLSKAVRVPMVDTIVNPFGHHKETSGGELSRPYLRMLIRVLAFMVQFPKLLPQVLTRYQADIAALEAVNLIESSDQALVGHIRRLLFESVNRLLNDDFLLILVIKRTYQVLGSLLGRYYGDGADEVVAKLISGVTGNVTMETNIRLWELSRVVKKLPQVEALFRSTSTDQLIPRLRILDQGRTFLRALESFLAEYGHREVKMSILYPTWREDPTPVLTFIAMYLDADEDHSPHQQQVRLVQERELLTEEVLNKVKEDLIGRVILTPVLRWMLKQSQLLTRERDTMHFEMTRLFPPFRGFLLELGRRWKEKGLVDKERDIFFLEIEELEELAEKPRVVKDLIQRRREEFAENLAHGSPNIIQEGDPIYPDTSIEAVENSDTMIGISGSPGKWKGSPALSEAPKNSATYKKEKSWSRR